MKIQRAPFIDRRHFLRGLGLALALPAFDSLNVGSATRYASSTAEIGEGMGNASNHSTSCPASGSPRSSGLAWNANASDAARGLSHR